jgi:hypothetical protein
VAAHATIDEYVAALPPDLAEVARAARVVIDRHLVGGASAIRWSHPTWTVGRHPICYLRAAPAHVLFGFWYGQSIRDPSGRLHGTGSIMAHAELRDRRDVDEELFAEWLRQARELTLADAG